MSFEFKVLTKIVASCAVLFLLTACQEQKVPSGKVVMVKDELATVQEYVNLFPDKVVYVDIWASWCGPCLKEMPHSINLQADYKDKDVVFLFLSVDENKGRWESTIKAKNITGYHVLATQKLEQDLEQHYELSGIPRYLLFNKGGKLVDKDADRPSDLVVKAAIDENL